MGGSAPPGASAEVQDRLVLAAKLFQAFPASISYKCGVERRSLAEFRAKIIYRAEKQREFFLTFICRPQTSCFAITVGSANQGGARPMPGLLPEPRHPKIATSAKTLSPSRAVESAQQCQGQSPTDVGVCLWILSWVSRLK